MPQHKGAIRRVRLSEKRRLANKGKKVELRKLLKAFEPAEAASIEQMKAIQSKLDRLAAKGLIHKNFAANKKSKLTKSIAQAKVTA
ncbi:MAG: 30S ribosomal protein S20 [Candidatus Kapaibacterium sp.]|jgi:small subunit ribosomal protein S20